MNAPERVTPLRQSDLASLATVSTQHAGLLNTLYGSGAVTAGDYEWRWCRSGVKKIDHWVRLSAGERQLSLGIAAAAIGDDVDFLWRNFDGAARDLAWCASFSPLLELLARVFPGDWLPIDTNARPVDEALDKEALDKAVFVDADFVIRRGGHCVAIGRCRFDASSPPHLESAVPDTFLQLPISIPIVVDRAVLSAGELSKLDVGAVVRINRRAFLDIGAKLSLPLGATDIVVKVTGTRLTVVDVHGQGSGSTKRETTEFDHGVSQGVENEQQ